MNAINSMSEKSFTYEKKMVIEHLEANLISHREGYEEAMKGFWLSTVEMAKVEMEKLKKKEVSEIRVSLQKPENHSSDYSDFIDALKSAHEETVELTIREFKRFVNDDWEWKEGFETMRLGYSAAL